MQSFTYPFVVEYRPGENHVIPKPEGYEQFRDRQPYSFGDGGFGYPELKLVTAYHHGSRSRLHPDTVGIGLYIFVDCHRCCNATDIAGAGQHHPTEWNVGDRR